MGRELTWRALCDLADESRRGASRLVLVTGEAGIGKSAIVAAVADRAREAGAVVAAGACWEGDGAPDYWPWVQVVRDLRRWMSPELWKRARAEAGPGLDRLLGERGDTVKADQAFAALEAVSATLSVVAREAPVLAVLEDLHWADPASLRLAAALVRHARYLPVLVIGTCRSDETASPRHPRHGELSELAAMAVEIPLAGLDAPAVGLLLARAGHAADGDLAIEVRTRTGGNPLFIQQLAQLWTVGGASRPIPAGIRAAIGRRLAGLSVDTAELLATAALLGPGFDPRLVAAASGGEGATRVAQAVDEAQRAGLVAQHDGDQPWRFVHDLVREELVASLSPEQARRRHAAVVVALDAMPDLRGPTAVTQLAHHAALAVPDVAPPVALGLLRAAAADARRRLAPEEAVAHLQRAVTLSGGDPSDDAQRRRLLVDLGTAQRDAGRLDDARHIYAAAHELARAAGDQGVVADALVGLHSLGDQVASHNDLEADLQRATATIVTGEDDRAAALTLAALARLRSHLVTGDRADVDTMASDAVVRARRSGSAPALAFCLLARHDAVWDAGNAAERLRLCAEMADVARRAGDADLELQAALLAFVARWELDDPAMARSLAEFLAAEQRIGLPHWRYVALSRRAAIATLEGRFDEAGDWIDQAETLGRRLGEADAAGVVSDQRWTIARLRGDVDEVATLAEACRASGDPHVIVYDITAAIDRGDTDAVGRMRGDFDALGTRWPRWATGVWKAISAEAAVAVAAGDREACERLRPEVAHLDGTWTVLGGGVLSQGPMSLWLGHLDLALGRPGDAATSFERAYRSARRLAARPWAVLAQVARARALLARHDPGDDAEARETLALAAGEAGEIGLDGVVRSIATLAGDGITGARPIGRFARDGDVWTLTFAGETVRMPDAKGLGDLRRLLRAAGHEIPATSLVDPADRSGAGDGNPSGADEVLDDRARLEYRRRLDELDEATATALARHDDDRARRYDDERAEIIAELRAAAGLGGRSRRLGGESERARKAVSARVNDTLNRIEQRHPPLATHLRASIALGARCSYHPAEPVDWQT